MNRFISILLGILVFLISFMPYETMAQNTTKTAYQKRMEQIDKEMAQKFGYSEPNDIVALEILNGMAEYLKGQNTSRAKIYSWYINEQEKAKKLKTQADFDREKREQDAALAQKKEAEAKRAAKMEELRLKYTDYYEVIDEIKKDFEKWCQKGEFESSTAYEERLKSKSESQFYNICSDNITTRYKRLSIRGELQQYNADNQYFPVKIYFNPGSYQEERYFNLNIPVSVENAPEFKNNYKKDAWHPKCDIGNLVFIDNYLVLKKISYSGKEYELPLEKYTEVKFAFKDLGIQNPYCQNAIWSVNTIRLAEEEQRRQDSISCSEYNRVMDSIVTAYNQELLQNEYNFDKETIKFYPMDLDEISGHEHEIKLCLIKDRNNITKKYNSLKESFETAKVACAEYNKQLDSIVDTYNQQLLQEEYNFEKQTIKSRKLECGQGIEKRFDKEKVVIDNDYKLIKQRIDSIACIEYNKQLESTVATYNQKLLQEEYNFDKKTVKFLPLDLDSGKKGQEIERCFNEERDKIDKKYNSIMDEAYKSKKIVDDYKQNNFKELVSFKFENYNNHDMYNNCPGYLTRNIANASAYNSRYSSALVEKLMEVTVDINTQLNNEWTKNGQYFENKVDFFNSFVKFWPYNVVSINPDYKTILKEKKKAKK